MCQWLWEVTWYKPTPFGYCDSDIKGAFVIGSVAKPLSLVETLHFCLRSCVIALSFVGRGCLLP